MHQEVRWTSAPCPNELPLVFGVVVVASTAPTLLDGHVESPDDRTAAAVALLTIVGLGLIARRALRARAALERALADALGAGWRHAIDAPLARQLRRRTPWARILLLPWPLRPRSVERIADIAYGDRGTENLLDVYRRRDHPSLAPTLVYLHGGGFTRGRKSFEARPLLHHLARQGWTCISANYRLAPTPAEGFPDHLVDVKRVIAWARTHGHDHGVDPDSIFVAGSSAGAHLATMAALTVDDAGFQPGFEAADVTIAAGIGLYGCYGSLGGEDDTRSDPAAHASATARPLFLVHGDQDTYTPVEGARHLVDRLRASSAHPVVYAELPGAQHSFDVFHSIRFEAVVDAIDAFAAWLRSDSRDEHRGGV